jgi:MFS family permease
VSPDAPGPDRRSAAGWALAAATIAYAVVIYYGIGPYPSQIEVPFWQPRGFLRDSTLMASFDEQPLSGVAAGVLPALILAAGACALARSALVRTAAVWAVLACAFFLSYGLQASRIWEFFGWRAGAVMALMSLVLAAALLAPWLAGSWLRLRWPLRLAVYLPILAAVVVTARNATGTNPKLAFNISPWPIVTVFGFDGLASLIAGILACLALGLAGWRLRRGRPAPAVAVAAIAAAVAIPVLWVAGDLGGGLLLLGAAGALAAVALWAVSSAVGNLTMGARSAAGYVATGALLLGIPLFTARACVQLDYRTTREGRAQQIIDGLGRHYEREGLYPERLRDLVEAGDLEAIPEPRIGFAAFGRQRFIYQNFGTDYLLEFAAPGWSQCAYNPPWQDEPEDGEFQDDEEEYADPDEAPEEGEALPGAWSCPSAPPELW